MATNKEKWSDEFLESMRQHTDPLGDATIKSIMENGEEDIVNKIFSQLRMNVQLERDDVPDDLKEYFEKASVLPEWADMDLIAKGEQFFAEYGVETSLLLFYLSLPYAYSCSNGAKVLAATGRLEEFQGNLDKFTRRLMETAQFVFNVGTAEGFSPKGVAVESAMKVRLMHACIRYFAKAHGGWPSEKYGEPINQEDMTGTMLSFCVLVYEGMDKMGLEVDPELRAGHFHLWRVIGYLMGVDPRMIPETQEEGHVLGHRILNRQQAASQDGVDLTKALLDFSKKSIPGSWFDYLPDVLIRYYTNDATADMLGIPRYGWFKRKFMPWFINWFISGLNNVEHITGFTAKLGGKLQLYLLQHTITQYYGYRNVAFYLPPGLRKNWPLKNSTDSPTDSTSASS
ncbi:MAG: oxygenase MpaB family protein [Bacteroidota bacterium]